MKRYSQEKIDNLSYDSALKLIFSGKCKVEETRVIQKEIYPGRIIDDYYSGNNVLFSVVFKYVITFPETILYEEETYEINIQDDIYFARQSQAEEYLKFVAHPCTRYSDKKKNLYLKEDYIKKFQKIIDTTDWHITADLSATVNEKRKCFDGFYCLYVNGRYSVLSNTIDKLLCEATLKYGAPISTEDVVEIIEKKYESMDFDKMIEDVEKLKTEKNKFIAEEIQRQTQYILTLKKLL